MGQEERRDIPGWEGSYAVTRDGRVWSHRTQRFLRGWLNHKGYVMVDLLTATARAQTRVHRAVALAWIPNPSGLPEVNHLDGVKEHNAVENLEWCSKEENIQHAFRSGLYAERDAQATGRRRARTPT